MSKGMAFVVGYSIFIFIVFCTMCYLMSTVNPPPLTIIENPISNDTRKFLHLNLKPLIVDNSATGDKVEYGLEKVRDDGILTSKAYPLYMYTSKRIDGFNGPNILDTETVIPPIWPPLTEPRNFINLPLIIVEGDHSKLKVENPSIKSYRRSINNDLDDSTSAIIFKVLQGGSRPRIEIKIDDGKRKNITIRKRNPKFGVSAPFDNYGSMEKPKLSDNNVINIASNDTAVIYDDENPSASTENNLDDIKTIGYINTVLTKDYKNTNMPRDSITETKSLHEIPMDPNFKSQKYTLNIGIPDGKIYVQNPTNRTIGL